MAELAQCQVVVDLRESPAEVVVVWPPASSHRSVSFTWVEARDLWRGLNDVFALTESAR